MPYLSGQHYQAIASRVGYSPTEILINNDPGRIVIDSNLTQTVETLIEIYDWRKGEGTPPATAWPNLFREAVIDKLAAMLALAMQQQPETAKYLDERALLSIEELRRQDDWIDTDIQMATLSRAEQEAWPYQFATSDRVVVPEQIPEIYGAQYTARVPAPGDLIRLDTVIQGDRPLRFDFTQGMIVLYDWSVLRGTTFIRGQFYTEYEDLPELFQQAIRLRVMARKALVWDRLLDQAKELSELANNMLIELRKSDQLQSGKDVEMIGRSEQESYPWHWNRKGTRYVALAMPEGGSCVYTAYITLRRDQLRIESVLSKGSELRYERCGQQLLFYSHLSPGDEIEVTGQWYVPRTEWPELFKQGVDLKAQAQREMILGGNQSRAKNLFTVGEQRLAEAKAADSQQQTAMRIQTNRIASARHNISTSWKRSRNG